MIWAALTRKRDSIEYDIYKEREIDTGGIAVVKWKGLVIIEKRMHSGEIRTKIGIQYDNNALGIAMYH